VRYNGLVIKLKSIYIAGFRKFTEPTTIEFPESGLLLLDGDSGAGKSTVMQAVAYALNVCPFPATTLKSWTGEALQVKLTLDVDGKIVVIARGKTTSLTIDNDVKTGAKAVEEGLANIFKLTPDLLQALTYRPQDTFGLFLSKDDLEKKEFLGQILGLNSIEKALEESDSARKKLQADLSFAQGILTEREAALRKILDQSAEVSPLPEQPEHETRLKAATEVVSSLKKELDELNSVLKAAHDRFLQEASKEKEAKIGKLQTAKSLYSSLKEKNDTVKFELETKRESIRSQIMRVQQELTQIEAAKREILQLQKEIDTLKSNKCYVCYQPFTAEAAIDQKQERLDSLTSQVSSETVLRSRWTELAEALKSLVPFEDPREVKLIKAISELEVQISQIGKNITDTRVLKAQEARDAKARELALAQADRADAEILFREFVKAKEVKEKLLARRALDQQAALESVDSTRAEIVAIESKLNAEKDFLHLLGKDGFLGVIFDEVLGEISDAATGFLGRLSNTAHVSVRFRTETAKGKKSISPVFQVGEFEATRSSGLSGGMGTSADLAVDLGVISVIERRLGTAPGWLMLDETFNGMPPKTKEMALEILQEFAKDRLVIVIDHGSELRSMFHQVLTVTDENGRSAVS
jgi:DNA repair exonuclease SbcCD ATPase subunit